LKLGGAAAEQLPTASFPALDHDAVQRSFHTSLIRVHSSFDLKKIAKPNTSF
jgi:hypothetical protein